ncbi:MAG: hypothetical protein RSF00_06040 [Oscillospiraceae bacterium]
MTAFLCTFISLVAVLALSAFSVRRFKLASGLAPLAVLSGSIIYFFLVGCLGFLQIGGYVYFAISAAACVYLVATNKKEQWKSLLTPGFILFCLLCVTCLVVFAIRKPILYEWDEYSFWGTAAKLTKDNNMLHAAVKFGWPWAATQKPGLPILSYIFNFFGEFAEWRLYFAYDTLLFAVAAAAIGGLSIKKWHIAVPIALAALVMPFFHIYTRMIYFMQSYLSSYADMPMGILMGGALCAYYYLSRHGGKGLWSVALMLGAVALCKDTGLPLSFVAAGIITIDILFCQKNAQFTFAKLRGGAAKAGTIFMLFATSAAMYKIWSIYLSNLGVAQGNVGGEADLSPFALMLNGVLLLFGINNTEQTAMFAEKFMLVRDNMISSFLHDNVTMVGPGIVVFALMFAILALTVFLSRDKLHRRRTVLYGVFASLGFLAYYVFIGFTYVFVFKGKAGVQLQDYNRYVTCYYVAMLVGAFALLAIGAQGGSRYRDLLTGVCITLGVCMLVLFGRFVQKQLCVIDYPDVVYDASRNIKKSAQRITDKMPEDARVFFVSPKDDGELWFSYSYELYPNILDFSWGGGPIADPAVMADGEEVNYKISKGQLAAYLVQSDCGYVYINDSDELFKRSYGELFEDASTLPNDEPQLYKVEVKDGYTIVEQEAKNGELMQSGSELPLPKGEVKPIAVMQNPSEYLTLVKVEMEAEYE